MVIYGTALLSGCLIAGVVAGQLLGNLVGVDKNIGRVGIAMLLLILVSDRLQRSGRIQPPTYIVGPVTGSALGATSDVIALSVAAGLIKSMLVMIMTPFVAGYIGLDNPRSALIFGGLMGTTSGVAGGLAATAPELVPYGAMTATFYTGLGCLLGPSVIFLVVRAVV